MRIQLADLHVVELLFVATPDGVIKSIVLCFDAKPLVRIIGIKRHAILSPKDALSEPKAPKLNGDMFGARLNLGIINVNGRAIEVLVVDFNAGDFQHGGSEIRVRRGSTSDSLRGDARPTDNERHVDVGLEAARLARMQPMLANVVAIVRGVEDEGVFEHAGFVETSDDRFNNLIYRLQRPETQPLVLVTIINDAIVEFRELRDPANAAGGIRVEVWRPGDRVLGEEALVPLCNLRRIKCPP